MKHHKGAATKSEAFGSATTIVPLMIAAIALGLGLGIPTRASTTLVDDVPTLISLALTAEGRLSMRVREVPLHSVLELIAEKANIRINTHTPLGSPVTAEFRDRPLDKALRVLLRHENYAFLYIRQGNKVRLREVWVIAKAESPLPPEASGDLNVLRTQTDSSDRSVRHRAIAKLGMRAEPGALFVLLKRLPDPDADVRRTIVAALGQSPHPRAVDALATVVTSDEDPGVRQLAAAALASRGGRVAAHALRLALEDEVPHIRTLARLFLEQLEAR